MTGKKVVEQVPAERILVSKVNTREIDEETLEDLTASIKTRGLKQPILLRPNGPYFYTVVFGRHRFEACKRAGLKEIPAFVEEMDDDEEMVLKVTENAHRNAFIDPVIEGEIFEKLLKKYGTVNALAEAVGKKTKYINDRLTVRFQLEPSIKRMIGKAITVTNAISIAKIPNHWKQLEVANQIKAIREHEGSGGSWGGGGGYNYPVRTSAYHKCPACGEVHRIKGTDMIIDDEKAS